jgi:hypothetical protein
MGSFNQPNDRTIDVGYNRLQIIPWKDLFLKFAGDLQDVNLAKPIILLLLKQLSHASAGDKQLLDCLVSAMVLWDRYNESINHELMTGSQTTVEAGNNKWLLRAFQELPNEAYLYLLQMSAGISQIPSILSKYFSGLLYLSTTLILANREG